MKKLILVLAIALMASPTFALTVYLQREGTTNVVDACYVDANTNNLPRAFALDVTIDSPGQISGVINYKTGESCAVSKGGTLGFGIYPASISIDTAGVVQNYGSPLAASADPPGLDSNMPQAHIILEFASLYFSDANKPAISGRLCQLTITPNTTTVNLNVRATAETTYRGGVVLSDGTQFPTDVNTLYRKPAIALPGPATTPYPANGAINVNRSTTVLTWVAGTGTVTSRDVYFGTATTPVTKVIADGTGLTYNPGTMTGKKTYYWRVDEKNSAGTTTGNVWNFTTICKGDYNASVDITTADISALVSYWNANKNGFGKAPLTGTGYVVGMDLTGDGFITTADISQLVSYWNANKNGFGKAVCMP